MRSSFDPFSPAAHEDPYPLYAELRERSPVHHNVERGIWLLSRYDDVQAAARDWRTFSSAAGNDIDDTGTLLGSGNFIDTDPPLHDELRKAVRAYYAPRSVATFEPVVRAEVSRRLGDARERSRKLEAVAELSWPLHVRLACRFLGLERLDEDALSGCLMRGMRRELELSAPPADARAAGEELRARLAAALAAVDPAADTPVASVARHSAREHAVGVVSLLLVAAVDTPSALLTNALLLLGHHAAQRAALLMDPARIGNAIEEVMRFAAPEQSVARVTTREVIVRDTRIPAGSRVVLLLASANRDERRFDAPNRFDVMRELPRHMAFGEGIHFCLGAQLARLIARVALEEVLAVAPAYRVLGDPVRFEKQSSWGLRRLELDLGPDPAARVEGDDATAG